MASTGDTEKLRRAAAQMLMVGFHEAPSVVPDSVREAVEDGLGGVILFRRNIKSMDQFMSLSRSIHQASPQNEPGPFLAVDQEGGRVVRLRDPLTPIPPMREVGDRGDPAWTHEVSAMMARELKAVGVNLNFAPVVDVDTNPDNPVIGDRSFSRDPREVAQHGRAFVAGHLENGVLPCAKHFPGHGDTHVDSHLALPSLPHDLARLERVELHPFVELFKADLPLLMTAHILFQSLDTSHPATLSQSILQDLLRKKLSYRGLVISDCLEMQAVSQRYTIEEMIELGLEAGIDIFLICHTESLWQRAWKHLVYLGQKSQEKRDTILSIAERIRALKRQHIVDPAFDKDGLATLGCPEHRAIFSIVDKEATSTAQTDPTEPTN